MRAHDYKHVTPKLVAQTNTQDLLTEFFDSGDSDVAFSGSLNDSTFGLGHTPEYDLAEWFKRPVKIHTSTWAEGSSLSTQFDPWHAYFSNAEIYSKIKGFSRLQATLHVKLTINASPYQYGMGIMSYYPLSYSTSTLAPLTEADDRFAGGYTDKNLAGATTGTEIGNLIVDTCRPHGYFYPQFSKGCEMILPFCFYKNWINLDSQLAEVKQMGRIKLYTPRNLLTSGTAATQPITVTVYAWCETHKVSGPSYALQADEYSDRPVSTACSVASEVAARLTLVPRLGPYAMATSTALSAMGTMARWFGYSNPPVIADIHANKINYMPSFASPEVCVQVDKLALDPKNEVTVDSRTVGLDGTDHMAISHVLGRDVAFATFDWAPSATSTTPLYVCHVDPMLYTSRGYNGATTALLVKSIQMTPSCQIGTLFDMWTGPITYSFTSVASQFHRGRLLVSYDPDGFKDSYTSAAYTGPRTISKVWDLAECPEFKFEVPYMAPSGYLRTGGLRQVCEDATCNISYKNPTLPATLNYKDGNMNGSIVVSVLNALTSSSPSSAIYVVVGINCGGLEFSNPRELEIPISSYKLQAGELSDEPDKQTHADVKTVTQSSNVVYSGEIARSLRQLTHRTNLYSRYSAWGGPQDPKAAYSTKIPKITVDPVTAASSKPEKFNSFTSSYLTPALPLMPGALHDPAGAGFSLANGAIVKDGSTTLSASNFLGGTHLGIPTVTAYLSGSYVGWRGSHVYHARVTNLIDNLTSNSQPNISDFSISRCFRCVTRMFNTYNMRTPFTWRVYKEGDITSTNDTAAPIQAFNLARTGLGYSSTGSGGFAVTNPSKVDVVDAIIPYYSNYRMLPCGPHANLVCNLDWNNVSWNAYDDNSENVLAPLVSVNTSVKYAEPIDNSITNITRHPTVDLYHKAGVDFTLFWYLNPPAVYVYVKSTDCYPDGWS